MVAEAEALRKACGGKVETGLSDNDMRKTKHLAYTNKLMPDCMSHFWPHFWHGLSAVHK
jgi:hypothetical protein